MSFVVSVQASPRDRDSWLGLAVDVEAAGFEGLYVGDHRGIVADPYVCSPPQLPSRSASGSGHALSTLACGSR